MRKTEKQDEVTVKDAEECPCVCASVPVPVQGERCGRPCFDYDCTYELRMMDLISSNTITYRS